MKNVFIDINILIDIFADRQQFVKSSLKIYVLRNDKKLTCLLLQIR